MVEFEILGPLQVVEHGRQLVLGGHKQLVVLAVLLLHRGEAVSTDHLIEELWGERPPPSAVKAVQVYVSNLRRALGDGLLVTRGRGYLLATESGQVDLDRFEALVAQGRRALTAGDAQGAGDRLRDALALWRGPALSDFADDAFAQLEIARLEEARLAAIEDRIEADLTVGEHASLVGELESLVAANPLRERPRAQLMLALYRSGRQADALAAYQTARRALVGELGIEPGRRLRELEQAILRQDRSLELTASHANEPVVCPFKGLAFFDRADAEFFCGRERVVADLIVRFAQSTLVGILGPSGIGKSSVLRAGLLPALSGGALPGSAGWRQVLMRPGEHPCAELVRALGGEGLEVMFARLPPGGRLVLAVDQLEELFTLCESEDERAAFLTELWTAGRDHARRALVVVSLRADFYGRLSFYPGFARLLSDGHTLIGPMDRDELAWAIEQPAARAGLEVERTLVDALVADVAGEPGGLPLLSTTLLELWRARDDGALRYEGYRASGGVRGAVARLAEDAYGRLGEAQRPIARNVMLRLAGGEDGALTRRRVPAGEIARIDGAEPVLATMTDARLLTVSDDEVELSHEALLHEWPRYRAWLEEDRVGRRLHSHLTSSAREWNARGRDPGDLYRGARLSGALDWAAQHEAELNQLERHFLAESHAGAVLEEERQRQANRRLRVLLWALGALLALAIVAGVVALDQRGAARQQAEAAEAQRLGAQSLSANTVDLSLLLARQGVALDDSLATRSNLLAALLRSPAAIHVLRGVGGRMLAVAVDPRGDTVVAGDSDGRVLAFDAGGRRLAASFDTGLPVRTLSFSPDGTRLAVASGHEGAGALDLLDAATLRSIAHRRLGPGPHAFHTIAFSPDSRVLVSCYARWDPSGNHVEPAMLARWDARTGRSLGPPTPVTRGVPQPVLDQGQDFLMAFAARGRQLVTMSEPEGETVVRDARTLRPVRHLRAGGLPWASAISPDGRFAALGRDDGSIRLVDLRTGKIRTPSARHDGSVQGAAFTADGKTLVTVGDDAKVIVWDVAGARPREIFTGQGGRIAGVALAPDGRTAYSASFDGTVVAWDLVGSRRLGQPFLTSPRRNAIAISETAVETPTGASYNIGVSPAGGEIAVALANGFVNLIDSRTLRVRGRIHALTDGAPATAATFSPDGHAIAISGGDGSVRVWNSRTLTPLSPVLHAGRSATFSPRFTPDGRLLITHGLDWVVRLWDTRHYAVVRKRQLHLFPQDGDVRGDGKVVAFPECARDIDSCSPTQAQPDGPPARGQDGVQIFALPSLRPVAWIPMKDPRWARFSRDGRLLVVGNHDGRAQLYDGHTFRPLGRPLLGQAGFILTADFSPDGRTLATSSSDGTVRLWDTASSSPIGTSLPGLPDVPVGVAFIRGGTRIAMVYDGGQAYVWDVRPSSWEEHACAVAGRTLTRAEWQQFLPGRDYAPACVTR